MISILDNSPRRLSARIGNIILQLLLADMPELIRVVFVGNLWVTPFFQGKLRSYEAMLLVLGWLFDTGEFMHAVLFLICCIHGTNLT